jgi:hypothetical protein
VRCLNTKALLGVGLAVVGMFLVAPGRAASSVPILLMLLCPLSMLMIMRVGGRHNSADGSSLATSGDRPLVASSEVADRVKALEVELRALKQTQAFPAQTSAAPGSHSRPNGASGTSSSPRS